MTTGMINMGKMKLAPWIMLNAAKLENSFFLYFAAILKIGEDSNYNVTKSILNNISMHSTPSQDDISQNNNDDIDLLLIVANTVNFLKKNGRKLLLSAVVGLFCGAILYFSLPKFYTSRLLLESEIINNTEVKTIVENWNAMLKPSGYPYLMKELNCDRATLVSTKRLAAEPINPQNEVQPGVIINVSVQDTSVLAGLQRALLNGFKDNVYVTRKVAQHRQGTISQIKKTDEEISKLDSSKQFIEGTVESVRKDKSPLILDVTGISAQKVGLMERKAALEERLEFVDGVQLIQGFSAVSGPKPGMFTYLGVGFLGGFLIAYFLMLLQSLNRKISRIGSGRVNK
jgi:hypothetical protein